MEGESKEADTKDNPSKQNNNLVESESNQESCSPSKKKEMNTDNKTIEACEVKSLLFTI